MKIPWQLASLRWLHPFAGRPPRCWGSTSRLLSVKAVFRDVAYVSLPEARRVVFRSQRVFLRAQPTARRILPRRVTMEVGLLGLSLLLAEENLSVNHGKILRYPNQAIPILGRAEGGEFDHLVHQLLRTGLPLCPSSSQAFGEPLPFGPLKTPQKDLITSHLGSPSDPQHSPTKKSIHGPKCVVHIQGLKKHCPCIM